MPKGEKSLFYEKIPYPDTSAFKKIEENKEQIKDKLKIIFNKIEKRDLKQAESLVKKFTNLYPNKYIGWIIYGDLLKLQKNYSRAILAYEKAINLEKNLPKTY
jgi:tetratricopeptide (TPR) repeat protein